MRNRLRLVLLLLVPAVLVALWWATRETSSEATGLRDIAVAPSATSPARPERLDAPGTETAAHSESADSRELAQSGPSPENLLTLRVDVASWPSGDPVRDAIVVWDTDESSAEADGSGRFRAAPSRAGRDATACRCARFRGDRRESRRRRIEQDRRAAAGDRLLRPRRAGWSRCRGRANRDRAVLGRKAAGARWRGERSADADALELAADRERPRRLVLHPPWQPVRRLRRRWISTPMRMLGPGR